MEKVNLLHCHATAGLESPPHDGQVDSLLVGSNSKRNVTFHAHFELQTVGGRPLWPLSPSVTLQQEAHTKSRFGSEVRN